MSVLEAMPLTLEIRWQASDYLNTASISLPKSYTTTQIVKEIVQFAPVLCILMLRPFSAFSRINGTARGTLEIAAPVVILLLNLQPSDLTDYCRMMTDNTPFCTVRI